MAFEVGDIIVVDDDKVMIITAFDQTKKEITCKVFASESEADEWYQMVFAPKSTDVLQ